MSGELGKLFREIDNKNDWIVLYDKIRIDSAKKSSKLGTKAAKFTQNLRLNRYRDVLPFDHSRVVLPSGSYINASHVRVEEAGREYILTQGPLPNTAEHFWEMVWHQRSKAVIMLNKVVEKCQVKCHQYFPIGVDSTENGLSGSKRLTFGDFEVTLIRELDNKHFSTRTLNLTHLKLKQSRELLHYQFNTWPDFSVPQSTHDFLEFLCEVRKSGALDLSLHGPPIIHCSAGIGRSGTFVIVDAVLVMAAAATDLSTLDIAKLITDLRQYRMGLIQTHDQLRFCWKAIIDALENDEWRSLLLNQISTHGAATAMTPPSTTNRLSLRRCVANMPTGASSSSDAEIDDAGAVNDDVITGNDDAIAADDDVVAIHNDVIAARAGDDVGVCRRRRVNDQNSSRDDDVDDRSRSSADAADLNEDDESLRSKRRKSSPPRVDACGDVAASFLVSVAADSNDKYKKTPSNQDDESLTSYVERMRQRELKAVRMRDKIDRIHSKLRESENWLARSRNFYKRHNFVILAGIGVLMGTCVGFYYYFR